MRAIRGAPFPHDNAELSRLCSTGRNRWEIRSLRHLKRRFGLSCRPRTQRFRNRSTSHHPPKDKSRQPIRELAGAQILMLRCPHSVYWPEGQPFAWGCGFCNPHAYNGTVEEAKKFRQPQRGPQHNPDRVYANPNQHKQQPGHCPECGSAFHIVIGLGKWWRCAECNTDFKAPIGRAAA